MEKVMIAKEEAAALESALKVCRGDKGSVVKWHVEDLWEGEQAPLNSLDLESICTALFNGYEIEPGPEEKVLELYHRHTADSYARTIIKQVIEAYDIQIKGINC